jgi:hypothetical protein
MVEASRKANPQVLKEWKKWKTDSFKTEKKPTHFELKKSKNMIAEILSFLPGCDLVHGSRSLRTVSKIFNEAAKMPLLAENANRIIFFRLKSYNEMKDQQLKVYNALQKLFKLSKTIGFKYTDENNQKQYVIEALNAYRDTVCDVAGHEKNMTTKICLKNDYEQWEHIIWEAYTKQEFDRWKSSTYVKTNKTD